jgi:hypothetical protein
VVHRRDALHGAFVRRPTDARIGLWLSIFARD